MFSNPHLREHLQLAFKSVLRSGSTQTMSRQQKTQEQRRAKREQRLQKERKIKREVASRDQRARLYTRIGVPQASKQLDSPRNVARTEESKDIDTAKEKVEDEEDTGKTSYLQNSW